MVSATVSTSGEDGGVARPVRKGPSTAAVGRCGEGRMGWRGRGGRGRQRRRLRDAGSRGQGGMGGEEGPPGGGGGEMRGAEEEVARSGMVSRWRRRWEGRAARKKGRVGGVGRGRRKRKNEPFFCVKGGSGG